MQSNPRTSTTWMWSITCVEPILQSTAKQLFQFLISICLVAGSYSSLHGECGWLPQWAAIRARELRKQCLNYSQIRRYPYDHYYDFKCMHPEGWQLSLDHPLQQKPPKTIPEHSWITAIIPQKATALWIFSLLSLCPLVSVSFITVH